MHLRRSSILGFLFVSALPFAVHAQQGDGTRASFKTNIFKPAKVDATPERIAQIKAPAGFAVSVFASGLKNSRVIAVAPDGTVYVSRRDQGDVVMLKDAKGAGRADGPPVIVAQRSGAHGIAIHDGKFYLVTVKELFVADVLPDGKLGPLALLAGDLPDAGQHANRVLAFGPDGMLYISVGSTCNDCNENNPENATILRVSPDGKSRTIFASGLRNTIGFDWNPSTGELWGLDNGIDFLGDEDQQEELNRIEGGKQYGWPHVYGAGQIYPQSTPVGDITKEQWKAASTPMVLGYTAHAAPMQLKFYSATAFPKQYQGDAFATMRGSWNREKPSGYEIVRIHFEDGQAKSIEPFVTGFLTDAGQTHIARPMGLAVAKDGALLMADDANGVIYRIAYRGGRNAAVPPVASVPAEPMKALSDKQNGQPLLVDVVKPRIMAPLKVSSNSFQDGGALATRYSSYADGVSPALDWSPIRDAQSYVVLVEDPDSKPVAPFVHWLAWNIPSSVTKLDEGVQQQPRLTEPDGVLQGRGTRGSAGYYGPHPPVGDPPHRYVFQVFALDQMLTLSAGTPLDEVAKAMEGHVLAKGKITGTYAQTVAPLK
jgi:Raf kinase inhibitor-like YbhB/YbcL family protein